MTREEEIKQAADEQLKVELCCHTQASYNAYKKENFFTDGYSSGARWAFAKADEEIAKLKAALEIAVKALPCDSGVEASGDQCDYCFAKYQIDEILGGDT